MNTETIKEPLLGGIPARLFVGRQVKLMTRTDSCQHGGVTVLKEVKGDAVRHRPHKHGQDEWALLTDVQPFWSRNPDLKKVKDAEFNPVIQAFKAAENNAQPRPRPAVATPAAGGPTPPSTPPEAGAPLPSSTVETEKAPPEQPQQVPAVEAPPEPDKQLTAKGGYVLTIADDADESWMEKLVTWKKARAERKDYQALVSLALDAERVALEELRAAGVRIREHDGGKEAGTEPAKPVSLSRTSGNFVTRKAVKSTEKLYDILVVRRKSISTREVHGMPGYARRMSKEALASLIEKRFELLHPGKSFRVRGFSVAGLAYLEA